MSCRWARRQASDRGVGALTETSVDRLPTDRDEAITELFAVYHRRMVGLAMLLVDDLPTAEDVVQDAFLALHRRWSTLRDPQAALEYLRIAVLNGGRSQLRRRRRAPWSQLRDRTSTPTPSAETAVAEHEEHDELIRQLAALPRRQQQVLVLRYYLDQSEAEIASTLAISSGSVKQHASRALATLTARLEAMS
jgi:RNA polymerase sigma-70 factor (sigma-E family)